MFEILKEKNELWIGVFQKSSICALRHMIKILAHIKDWQITDYKKFSQKSVQKWIILVVNE